LTISYLAAPVILVQCRPVIFPTDRAGHLIFRRLSFHPSPPGLPSVFFRPGHFIEYPGLLHPAGPFLGPLKGTLEPRGDQQLFNILHIARRLHFPRGAFRGVTLTFSLLIYTVVLDLGDVYHSCDSGVAISSTSCFCCGLLGFAGLFCASDGRYKESLTPPYLREAILRYLSVGPAYLAGPAPLHHLIPPSGSPRHISGAFTAGM